MCECIIYKQRHELDYGNSAMGIHTKQPDMISNTTNNWVNSLSFSGYLNSKDREQPNSSPDGFELAPTRRGSSLGNDEILVLSGTNRSSPYIVRNNSIRRGSQEIRDKENKSSWSSGWSVFRSFVSPCRECRASKPNAVQPRPTQRPSSWSFPFFLIIHFIQLTIYANEFYSNYILIFQKKKIYIS